MPPNPPTMSFHGPPPGFATTQAQSRILNPSTGMPFESSRTGDNFRGDGFPVPHVWQFTAVLSGAQQTYFHDSWDEARRNSRQNALAMERDVFLQAVLQERKLASSGLSWHVEVDDEKDPFQKMLKDGLQVVVRTTPYLQRHHYAALDAIWYGRQGVQHRKIWKELELPAVNFQPAVAGLSSTGGPDQLSDVQPYRRPRRYALGVGDADDSAGGQVAGDASGTDPSAGFAYRGAPAVLTRTTKRRRCWIVDKHQPVNGDSIGHKWDGTPYMLVYSARARQLAEQGAEIINPGDPNEDPLPPGEITLTTGGSYGLVLREPYWRDRFVIHSHLSIAADFFEVERAEAIHGAGIRDVLYWFWWLKNEWLEWVVTYFERVGLGISLWYYEAANTQSYNEVFKLAEQQSRRANILVPWYANKQGGGAGGLERIETPVAGAEALLGLKKSIEEHAERYIIGQTLSSDHRGSGGLGGSGAAEFQQNTKFQIVKFDAENLADTYTQDWLKPTQQECFPDLAEIPCRFAFNTPDPEGAERLEAVTAAYSMGVDFIKNEVRALTGLSDPQPGDDVIGQVAMPLGDGQGSPTGSPVGDELTGGVPSGNEAGKTSAGEPVFFDAPQQDQGPVFFERAGGPERYADEDPISELTSHQPSGQGMSHPALKSADPLHLRGVSEAHPLTTAPVRWIHPGRFHTGAGHQPVFQHSWQSASHRNMEESLKRIYATDLAIDAIKKGQHAANTTFGSAGTGYVLIADPQGRVSAHRGHVGENQFGSEIAQRILPGTRSAFRPFAEQEPDFASAQELLRKHHADALAAGNLHTQLQIHPELPPELLHQAMRGDRTSQIILADWLEERGHHAHVPIRQSQQYHGALAGSLLNWMSDPPLTSTHYVRSGDILHYAAQGPSPGSEGDPIQELTSHQPSLPAMAHPSLSPSRPPLHERGLHVGPAPLTGAPLRVVHHGLIHGTHENMPMNAWRIHSQGLQSRAPDLAHAAFRNNSHAYRLVQVYPGHHHMGHTFLISDPEGRVSAHANLNFPAHLHPFDEQRTHSWLREMHQQALAAGNIHTELQLHPELPHELVRGALAGDKAHQEILGDWLAEREHGAAPFFHNLDPRFGGMMPSSILAFLQEHPKQREYQNLQRAANWGTPEGRTLDLPPEDPRSQI